MSIKNFINKNRLLLIFIGISIFLRLINITSEQLWNDEAGSIDFASSSINDFWTNVINDVHPPLFYIILRGWIYIFGISVFSCRLLSVIFSVLTSPILYLIGKEIRDKKLGLIILFFYSLSPFSIYFANEVRSYSFLALLFTAALYFAIKSLKEPNLTKFYIFLSIIGILLIYTHYMGIVFIGVLGICLFIFNLKNKSFYKNIIFFTLIIIVAYIPWLPYAIEDALGGAHGYAGGRLNLINLLYFAFNFFLAPVPSNINDSYVSNLIILTFLICLPLSIISILSLIGFFYFYRNNAFFEIKTIINFIILITLLFFGIPIIIGFIIENSFSAKNIIGGLSLVYIIYSFGIYYLIFDKNSSFFKNGKRLLRILKPQMLKKLVYPLVLILLICNAILFPILRACYLQKPDWDGCVKKLKKDFRKGDIIINLYGGQIPAVMEYYSNLNDFDLSSNSYILSYNEETIEEFFKYVSENGISRIWIVIYWQNILDPENLTEKMVIEPYNLYIIAQYDYRLNITLVLYRVS